MKLLSVILILSFTSCALWKEIDEKLDLNGTRKPRPEPTTVSSESEISQESMQPAKIIDEIRIKSEDNKSVFVVMKTSKDDLFASIYLENTLVNYKAGHSVELNMDNSISVHEVEGTLHSDVIRFANPKKLLESLRDKKYIDIEIIAKDNSKKNYRYEISKLVNKL